MPTMPACTYGMSTTGYNNISILNFNINVYPIINSSHKYAFRGKVFICAAIMRFFNHILLICRLLVMLAQNFQKCTFEEHLKAAAEITTFAQHCADHEEEEECKKPMVWTFATDNTIDQTLH